MKYKLPIADRVERKLLIEFAGTPANWIKQRTIKVGRTQYNVERLFPSGYYATWTSKGLLRADTLKGLRQLISKD